MEISTFLFSEFVYEQQKRHGQLLRRIKHIEERQGEEMTQVDDLMTALSTFKGDITTKFGELTTEFNKIEQEKSEGKEPNLDGAKQLIADMDTAVRGFDPTTAGGGSEAPPAGGTPAGEPSGTPAAGGAPAGEPGTSGGQPA